MSLIHDTCGTDRGRVMHLARGEWDDPREASARIVPEGAFSAASTRADNAAVVATHTVKTLAYIVVRETPQAESYGLALARRVLDLPPRVHPRVECATVTPHETRWLRPAPGGEPHPQAVSLDRDGEEYARSVVDRRGKAVAAGEHGFMAPFGMGADTQTFGATDEPHGRIACRRGQA